MADLIEAGSCAFIMENDNNEPSSNKWRMQKIF
jgi:hypothetical protein